MKHAYLRESTGRQTSAAQRQGIASAGHDIERWHEDAATHRDDALDQRPGWTALLDALAPGDEVIVYALDRLGEGMTQLQARATLEALSVGLVAVVDVEPEDAYAGTVLRYLRAGLAAAERARIRQRTLAGLAAARERGSKLGRPRREVPKRILEDIDTRRTTIEGALEDCNEGRDRPISRATLIRRLGDYRRSKAAQMSQARMSGSEGAESA